MLTGLMRSWCNQMMHSRSPAALERCIAPRGSGVETGDWSCVITKATKLTSVVLLVTLGFVALPAFCVETANQSASIWKPDVHYVLLRDAELTRTGLTIEVVEVFWYSCPHCYMFEPYLVTWSRSKPRDVELRLIPAQWNRFQRADARLYYALVRLQRADLHEAVYHYVHKDRKKLSGRNDDETLTLQTAFAVAHRISPDRFQSALRSKQVADDLKLAERLAHAYRATATPSIIVNGRYLTDENIAGGHTQLIAVTNHLVELERARLKARLD